MARLELMRELLRLDRLSEATAVGGHDVLLWRELGGEFIAAENLEAALACRKRAFELAPGDEVVRLELTKVLVRLDRLSEAVAIGGDDVPLWRDLGGEFLREGRIEQGLRCRTIATELRPNDPIIRQEKIRSAWHHNLRAEARAEATRLDLSTPGAPRHDFTPHEREIFSLVTDLAIQSPDAVASLIRAVSYVVAEKIPGAFVECGVYKGGAIMTMMLALLELNAKDRDIYLFDTFEGMPMPQEVDAYHSGRSAEDEWRERMRADGTSGWVVSTLDETKANIDLIGYPRDRIFYVKGLVEETLPKHAPSEIALLRLDTDFYSSTKHELVHLFPRIPVGGILIIDDYGVFRGSQLAVDEYFRENNIRFFLGRADANVRIGVKIF
jgi:tetratricopeptide (TPR) repeat protein